MPINTMKQAPSSPEHLGFLDGIRGLAALWVLIGHCMIWSGSYWYRFPAPIIAVDVFMFVSGYLMVHQWTRRVGTGTELTKAAVGEFWLRRVFRIAPVFWFALAITILWHDPLIEGLNVLRAAKQDTGVVYDPANYLTDAVSLALRATFLFGFIPRLAVSPFMGDWSLALEMQFYASFPFVMVLLRRWGAAILLAGSLVLMSILREILILAPEYLPGAGTALPLPMLLPLKLPVFLVGMILAEARNRIVDSPLQTFVAVVLAMIVAAMQAWQVAAVAALSFLVVCGRNGLGTFAGRTGADWISLVMGNRFMTLLADCSYAVYLFHSMAICLWGGYLWKLPWFLSLHRPVRMGLLVVVVTASVYPLAWIIHLLVEKPGIQLGRWFCQRWTKAPSRV
jgi:peptidoglycan/LPS O-acetylase OafA/YrhL